MDILQWTAVYQIGGNHGFERRRVRIIFFYLEGEEQPPFVPEVLVNDMEMC
jgi:hypothetical protein